MIQQTLRPYLTTGVALVGAGAIALVPATPQLPDTASLPRAQAPAVALSTDSSDLFSPYVDLFDNTVANLQAMGEHAFDFPILNQILEHPQESLQNLPEVVHLFTTVLPEINADVLPFPAQLSVDLPPMLTLLLAEIGPWVTMFNALQDIAAQVFDFTDPWGALTALITAPAVLLDAFLNGHDGIDLLGQSVSIFNGILVGQDSFDLDVGLGQLVDQLGIGDQTLGELLDGFGLSDTSLTSLLTSVVDGLGYGDLTPVELLDELGIGDQSVASLLSGVLDNLGYGDLTPVGVLDELGIGEQSLASLAISLLDSLGIDNPSITDLASQGGIGDESVAQLLEDLLGQAGVDPDSGLLDLLGDSLDGMTVGGLLTDFVDADTTVSDLADQAGLGDITVADVVTQLLDSAGFGDQTPAELVLGLLEDQFGTTADTGIGEVLITVLQDPDIDMDMTLNEAIGESGMGDTSLGDLVQDMGIADEPFKTLIPDSIIGTPICDLQDAVAGWICSAALGNDTLNDWLGNNSVLVTMQNLKSDSGVPLADKTLADVIAATGQGDEHLSDIIGNLGLTTSIGDALNTLGFNDVTLDDALVDGFHLDNTTLLDLLNAWDMDNLLLSDVIADLGLNDVYITDLLEDLNLDNIPLSSVLEDLLGGTTVNEILGDLDLDNVHLNDVLDDLLSGVHLDTILSDIGLDSVTIDDALDDLLGDLSVGSLLGDIGLNDLSLDQVIGGLGLDDVTIGSLLDDLGVSSVDVGSLLDSLGLSDTGILDAHIGDFFGLLPDLFDWQEQIAGALGA